MKRLGPQNNGGGKCCLFLNGRVSTRKILGWRVPPLPCSASPPSLFTCSILFSSSFLPPFSLLPSQQCGQFTPLWEPAIVYYICPVVTPDLNWGLSLKKYEPKWPYLFHTLSWAASVGYFVTVVQTWLIQPPSSPNLEIFTFIIISTALEGDLASPQQALFGVDYRTDPTVNRAWHAKKWVWHKVRSLKSKGEIKLHKQHWEWKSSPAKKWKLGCCKRSQKLGSSWKKNHLNS